MFFNFKVRNNVNIITKNVPNYNIYLKKNKIFLNSLIMFLFCANYLFSQDTTSNEHIYTESNITDTIATYKDSMQIANEYKLVYSPEEFMYADTRRWTITGDLPNRTTEIKPWNFAIFTGTFTGFMVAQHIIQMETIWKEQTKFKVMEDGPYAFYSDKAGHLFGTYLVSYSMSEGFLQSGLSWDAATIWGAAMGLSYQTYVEILDGYGKGWGFSPSDFYMDVAGAGLFVAQRYFPVLQNFTVKFQYFPAPWFGEKKRVPSEMFIDDYSSHTLWMSVNVYNLLPESAKKYWINGIDLAFGYAARNLTDIMHQNDYQGKPAKNAVEWNGYYANPKFIMALDYNLVKILPDGGYFWNWIKQTLNLFKLPSPAIEFGINEKPKYYILYPFKI